MAKVNKSASVLVAKIISKNPIMDAVADRVAAEVKAGWEAHADTHEIAASIQVKNVPGKKGVRDRIIYSDAPGVISAEFGHLAGKRTSKKRKYVPGLHIFGKAVGRQ